MPLSFQCPHCSQLFDASPEMFGQACACERCSGLFIVPAPVDSGGGQGEGLREAAEQEVLSLTEERRRLGEEADDLRMRFFLKEQECDRVIAERDSLQRLSQTQINAAQKREEELAESERVLIALRSKLESFETLLGVAEAERKKEAARAVELGEELRKAHAHEVRLKEALQRIEQIEAEGAKTDEKFDAERARGAEVQGKLIEVQNERDLLIQKLEETQRKGEQSVVRLLELQNKVDELSGKLAESTKDADVLRQKSACESQVSEERLKELNARILRIQAERVKGEEELALERANRNAVLEKLATVEKERDALVGALEASRAQLERSSTRIGELEKKTEELILKLSESGKAADIQNKKSLEEAGAYEAQLRESMRRIGKLEEDCARSVEELAREGASRSLNLEKLNAVEKERDVLVKKLEEFRARGEEANTRLREFEKNAEVELAAVQGRLSEVLEAERHWREQAGNFESKAAVACAQVSELESAIRESNKTAETLRLKIERQEVELAQMAAVIARVPHDGNMDQLQARVGEFEAKQRVWQEQEFDLRRQLEVKTDELALMHHRLIQLDQDGRDATNPPGILSVVAGWLWGAIDAVDRLLGSVFSGFAGRESSYRRSVSVLVCMFLTLLLFGAGVSLNRSRVGSVGAVSVSGPSDLVETNPMLREIEEEKRFETGKSETTAMVDQPTSLAVPVLTAANDASPKASQQESTVSPTGPASAAQSDPKLSPPVESPEALEASTKLDSGLLAMNKGPSPSGEGANEGKEQVRNLSRTALPNQFLGTTFGTPISEVANLANWSESNGRLRRKATLVGAGVEAVLIPDHENRVMAGAYVRICPRSTESLAPFLEWAVSVQDAIDAEYGEASTVHEVSEADDAAGVVERIANGKDFYEAIWERQPDDGFIVLSIRVFNERSVVFRLEYLNRVLLAAYTAQQKEALPAEPSEPDRN